MKYFYELLPLDMRPIYDLEHDPEIRVYNWDQQQWNPIDIPKKEEGISNNYAVSLEDNTKSPTHEELQFAILSTGHSMMAMIQGDKIALISNVGGQYEFDGEGIEFAAYLTTLIIHTS